MSYLCPKGCQSSDPDYCSECGTAINTASIPSNQVNTSGQTENCPDCTTPRVGKARYCEVCRYDFEAHASYTPIEVPELSVQINQTTTADTSEVMSQKQTFDTEASADAAIVKLNAVVIIDPDMVTDEAEKTNCPKADKKVFPLDLDENLLGRRSDGKGIYPEIQVNDPGVSRRHLKFVRQADGTFSVLELGSTNGTIYNGSKLVSGVLTPVKAGDEFIIGMCTRVRLEAR